MTGVGGPVNQQKADEDEQLLKDIMVELGGALMTQGGMQPNIKSLFKLTLQQIKQFKQEQIDLNKKVEKLEAALDRDITNSQ